ncbi:hypothetical protein [Caldicellulosiruptor danielii]|uniref:Uncharacterized protein n=1 Tax=Anaerocellum danielii TaxID=1387557 RepID=A0ABZ0U059_9FIRM|nr:hypothetical protein [Caldicellulosiruptor danielii]WPX08857.1 hypothetical protein SOJ16_000013 [Caldicellulosiruptor danielii]
MVESSPTSEGNFVTFHKEGYAYMTSELQKVVSYFSDDSTSFGIAVHLFQFPKSRLQTNKSIKK